MSPPESPDQIVGPHTFEPTSGQWSISAAGGKKWTPRGRIANRIDVEPAIMCAMAGRWAPVRGLNFFDSGYYLPTIDEVSRILAASRVAIRNAVDELFDCEDFAFGVRGEFSLYAHENAEKQRLPFAFGVLVGGFQGLGSNHAMCFFLDAGLGFHLINPQKPKAKSGADAAPTQFTDIEICYDCYLLFL